jgi:hypothetical protein
MALIPVYHVVPSFYAMDPAQDTVNNPIIMGDFVTLNISQYVAVAVDDNAIGIAGDSAAADGGHSPYAADIIVSGGGAVRSTSNRVSDFFDETRGSGKMTVYHSGGEFLTDRWELTPAAQWLPGHLAYSSATGQITPDAVDANSISVGKIIHGPEDYPSGVPGIDIQGSISLGQYVRFKLDL